MQLVNNAISVVWGNLTLDPLLRKNKNKTTNVRRCYFTAHTLILQKEHCKQSLHLRKALNGATEIDAGAAPPGRIKEKSSWAEVTRICWLLWSKFPKVTVDSSSHPPLKTGWLWHEGQASNLRTSSQGKGTLGGSGSKVDSWSSAFPASPGDTCRWDYQGFASGVQLVFGSPQQKALG